MWIYGAVSLSKALLYARLSPKVEAPPAAVSHAKSSGGGGAAEAAAGRGRSAGACGSRARVAGRNPSGEAVKSTCQAGVRCSGGGVPVEVVGAEAGQGRVPVQAAVHVSKRRS